MHLCIATVKKTLLVAFLVLFFSLELAPYLEMPLPMFYSGDFNISKSDEESDTNFSSFCHFHVPKWNMVSVLGRIAQYRKKCLEHRNRMDGYPIPKQLWNYKLK